MHLLKTLGFLNGNDSFVMLSATDCAFGPCDPQTFPDIVTGVCVDINTDLIDKVLVGSADVVGFTQAIWDDPEDLVTALTARLGQTGTKTVVGITGNAAIRTINSFDAQMPDVENVLTYRGKTFTRKGPRTIEWVDADVSPENIEWHNKMNCIGFVRAWWAIGKWFDGGADGIIASFTSRKATVQNDAGPTEVFNTKLTFEIRNTPPRVERPAVI